MRLGPGEAHVWYRLLDGDRDRNDADAWALLSSAERARAGRFIPADAREIFVHAHALLRTVLSAYTGAPPEQLEFVCGGSGKPALAPGYGPLEFNLSHAHGLVACAVSATPVGIDVEPVDRDVPAMDLANRFFSPPEVSWLAEADESERRVRFLELWTLKEAYVKAIGAGLSHPLNTFGFGLDTLPSVRFTPPHGEAHDWQFALYAPSNRFRLALAVRSHGGTSPRVEVHAHERSAVPEGGLVAQLLGRSGPAGLAAPLF